MREGIRVAPSHAGVDVYVRPFSRNEAIIPALPADAPIAELLKFTHYSKPQPLRERAAATIAAHPAMVEGMSEQIRSENRDDADVALRAVALMQPPPVALAESVNEVGVRIGEEIRAVNATAEEEDPSYERAAAAELRFVEWHEAARVLHGQQGVDLRPIVKEIHDLAAVREESHSMRGIVRITSHYLKKWAGD